MIYRKCEFKFLIVVVLFTIFSCKKDAAPNPVWKVTIDSPIQFDAVINGSIVSFNRYELFGTEKRFVDSIKGIAKTTFTASVGDSVTDSTIISNIEIDKGQFQGSEDSLSTCSEMQQFMLNGLNIYSDSAVNGIQVIYIDQGGTKWSTSLGSRNQLNASFEILDSKMEELWLTHNGGRFDVCCLKSLIKFNCTLYDKSGRSIELTDGLFLGDFPDYMF